MAEFRKARDLARPLSKLAFLSEDALNDSSH